MLKQYKTQLFQAINMCKILQTTSDRTGKIELQEKNMIYFYTS